MFIKIYPFWVEVIIPPTATQEKKLKVLANELAKDIKTGEDLSSLSSQLVKLTVEAALGVEMEKHLGYSESEKKRGRF